MSKSILHFLRFGLRQVCLVPSPCLMLFLVLFLTVLKTSTSPPWEKQTPLAVDFSHFDGLRIRELSVLNHDQNDSNTLSSTSLSTLPVTECRFILLTRNDSNNSIRGLRSHSSLFFAFSSAVLILYTGSVWPEP